MNLRTLFSLIPIMGCNLQLSSDQGVFKLSGSGARDVWAIAGDRFGARDRVLHYNGDWSEAQKFSGDDLGAIHAPAASDVWVAGRSRLHHFDGATWSTVTVSAKIIALGDDWAVGDHGAVMARVGASWVPLVSSSSMTVDAVWGTSSTDLWAVVEGSVRHFDGHAWELAPAELPGNLQLGAIWGSGRNDVWAAGTNAAVHFDGQHWTSTVTAATANNPLIFAIWGSGPGNVWASGYPDLLLHNWSPLAHGSDDQTALLDDIWGSAPNDIWIAGYQKLEPAGKPLLRHFDGTTWTGVPVP